MIERCVDAFLAVERHGEEMMTLNLDECIRAVIAALREPTEDMVKVGVGRALDLIEAGTSSDYTAREVWAAVIDAALAEPTR
jgi:hypothetical protein